MTKPVLAVQTPDGRMYVHPKTGEQVYSVTTIIGNGIPKPNLVDWAAGRVARYAADNIQTLSNHSPEEVYQILSDVHNSERDKAAAKGDEVHDKLENFEGGETDDPHLKQWNDFLDVSGFEIVLREVTLWNRRHGYAGTADWIAKTPRGNYVLGDTKTGNSIHAEHAVQVEALARCETIVDAEGNETSSPVVDYVGILHLRPKSWWYHSIEDIDAADTNFETFLSAKRVADWRRLHPSLVLGEKRMNHLSWNTIGS